MSDASRLGVVAAGLMEEVAENCENGERVGEVMILVEMRGEDDEGHYTYISWRCSDEREWVQRGMLHAGLDFKRVVPQRSDEEDEDWDQEEAEDD